MQLLQQDLATVDVTVSSDYSPDLADAMARGRLDVASMRAEPGHDLEYRVIGQEELVMLMPSDHKLTKRKSVEPKNMLSEPYVAMGGKAKCCVRLSMNTLRVPAWTLSRRKVSTILQW